MLFNENKVVCKLQQSIRATVREKKNYMRFKGVKILRQV